MKNLIKYGFIAAVSCLFFSCNKTGIEQYHWKADIVTEIYYNGERIDCHFDEVGHKTNDSIKCIRYEEGLNLIEKWRRIEKINCNTQMNTNY